MADITSFTSASEKQYIFTLCYFIVDKRWQTLHHLHQLQRNSTFSHIVILLWTKDGRHYIIYISFRETVHFHTLLFYCRQKMADITSFTSASEKQYIFTHCYFIVDKRWQTLHHLHQLQRNSTFPHFVILLWTKDGRHYIIYISFRQTVHFHTLLFYCGQKMADIISFTSATDKQYIFTHFFLL